MRTLPECSRVYKQQLRQQEQISLEVLDQVQESLSLLQTLYRNRTFSTSTASTGEQTAVEVNDKLRADRSQETETPKTGSDPQPQDRGVEQQGPQDLLWRAYRRSEDHRKRRSYGRSGNGESSLQANSCKTFSDEGVTGAEGPTKTLVLQHSQLERFPCREHTLCTQQQGRDGCGQLRFSTIEHGKRLHSEAEDAYVPTASSSSILSGNGDVTGSKEEETLYNATLGPPCSSLHCPLAVATESADVACVSPQAAARARPSFVVDEGSSRGEPNSDISKIPTDRLRDEQAATHTCSRRDVACTANLPTSVIIRSTSPPGCPRVISASPSSELLRARAVKRKGKYVSCQRAIHESVSATTACKQSNCFSDFPAQQRPPAVTYVFPTPDEDFSYCEPRGTHLGIFSKHTTANEYTLTTEGQEEALQGGDLHENKYFSPCATMSRPAGSGCVKRDVERGNVALTGVRAYWHDVKSMKSRGLRGGKQSSQHQTVDSAVQAPSPKTDVCARSCISSSSSRVTTCPLSNRGSVDAVADHRYHSGKAAASRAAKPLFQLRTSAADAGSRNDIRGGSVSSVAADRSGAGTAHEECSTEADRVAVTANTILVPDSPAYCRQPRKKCPAQCSENNWQMPASRSPDTSPPASGSSTIESETEGSALDFPFQSDLEDGRNGDQQMASRSRWQKTDLEKNEHWQRTRGKQPLHQILQEPGMRVVGWDPRCGEDPQALDFWKDPSQAVGSLPSQNALLTPPLQASSLQRPVYTIVPAVHRTHHTAPPGALLWHYPNEGRAAVRPSSVINTGEENNSLSASVPVWEKQWAAYRCVASAPQPCTAERHLPQRPRICEKKGTKICCVSTAPSSSPSTPALSSSHGRPCAGAIPAPSSVASRSETFSGNDLLAPHVSGCCAHGFKQQTARLGKARCVRRCYDQLRNASSLRTGRRWGAVGGPRTTVPPKEMSQQPAQGEGSQNDNTSTTRFSADTAARGTRLFTGFVGKEPDAPLAHVASAFCKDATSSYVPDRLLTLVFPTCAEGDSEYPENAPEIHPSPSICADSPCPHVNSAAPAATDTTTPPACCSLAPDSLSRRFEPLTSAESSHVPCCILWCRPLPCNPSLHSAAQRWIRRGRPAHKFCAREENASQTGCICTGESYSQRDTKCRMRKKSAWRESWFPECSEVNLCCGAHKEAPTGETQLPLMFGASAYSDRDKNHKQLHAHSLSNPPSQINKPAGGAHARSQLTLLESSDSCAIPVEQMQAATAKVMPNSTPSKIAQIQNHLGTHRRRRPTTFPQPARSASIQTQLLCGAPVSHDATGACQIPNSYTDEVGLHGTFSRTTATPCDCFASHGDAERDRGSRRQTRAASLRTHPQYAAEFLSQEHGTQESKANVHQVSFRQQDQCQQSQPQRSQLRFPLVHYGRTHYPRSGIETKPDNYEEFVETPSRTRTDNVYEDPQRHPPSRKAFSTATAPSCGVACCSSVQPERKSSQQTTSFSDTSHVRNNLAFSVTSGVIRTETAGITFQGSSMRRRLSTASTHAGDASPEPLSQAGVSIYQNQSSITPPQKDRTKRQVSGMRRDGEVCGSSTLHKTFQLRKAIIRGEHAEQFHLRTELKNTFTEAAGKLTPFPLVQTAAQECFGVMSPPRCKPGQTLSPSPSPCPPHGMISHGEREEAFSRELSAERCQCVTAEIPERTHQGRTLSEEHRRDYFVENSQETGSWASMRNQSHLIYKMLPSSTTGRQPHSVRNFVLQASEAKGGSCTSELSYNQPEAVGRPQRGPAAVLDGTESATSLQPSSFIFRMAAAEAAAILRNDG